MLNAATYIKERIARTEEAANIHELQSILNEAFAFLDGRLRAGEPLDSSLRPMIGELIDEIERAEESFKLEEFRNRASRVLSSVCNALPA